MIKENLAPHMLFLIVRVPQNIDASGESDWVF